MKTMPFPHNFNHEHDPVATRDSWQITPIDEPKAIVTDIHFTEEQYLKVIRGFIPSDMDERYFVYVEKDWIFIHRSWVGFGIYKAEIKKVDEGYVITEFLVERNGKKYQKTNDSNDREEFAHIITTHILHCKVDQIIDLTKFSPDPEILEEKTKPNIKSNPPEQKIKDEEPKIKKEYVIRGKYYLRVYDNYHYMDESEAYNHGDYNIYDEAENAAKNIVKESLLHLWQTGSPIDDVYSQYTMYGEDPAVLSVNQSIDKIFSARTYAKLLCDQNESSLSDKSQNLQDQYQKAIAYAAKKHADLNQTIPGTNIPYVVHLSNVAMEVIMAAPHMKGFNLCLAVQVALLHDVLEDTNTSKLELEDHFGFIVAESVSALTKNKSLSKDQQIQDSIRRIKQLPKEIWAVKIADRITNLQPPPMEWNFLKKYKYWKEAKIINIELGECSEYLLKRILDKMDEYSKYMKSD